MSQHPLVSRSLADLGKAKEGPRVIPEVVNIKHGLRVRQFRELLREASVDSCGRPEVWNSTGDGDLRDREQPLGQQTKSTRYPFPLASLLARDHTHPTHRPRPRTPAPASTTMFEEVCMRWTTSSREENFASRRRGEGCVKSSMTRRHRRMSSASGG